MFSKEKETRRIQLLISGLALVYLLFLIMWKDYTILSSIDSGLDFIQGSQLDDGSFVDYDTDTGLRRSFFPTFFVPWNLIPVSVLTGGDISFLDSSIKWIKENRNQDGLWGFKAIRDVFTSDPDDSAYAVFALLNYGDDFEGVLEGIAAFQTENGGFKTWHDEFGLGYGVSPMIQDNLITAVAAYVLGYYDRIRYEDNIRKAAGFLARNQNESGYWGSFWYYGRYQPTYYAVRLLVRLGGYEEQILNAGKFIMGSQNPDGGWGEPSNSFDTAHAILSLLLLGEGGNAVDAGVKFLLGRQDDRGAWETWPHYMFLPPAPTGSAVSTTAVVLKALACYEKAREGPWHLVLSHC